MFEFQQIGRTLAFDVYLGEQKIGKVTYTAGRLEGYLRESRTSTNVHHVDGVRIAKWKLEQANTMQVAFRKLAKQYFKRLFNLKLYDLVTVRTNQ